MNSNAIKQMVKMVFALFLGIFSVVSANAIQDDFCWKDSKARGAGTIPTGCGPGQENDAGLCYNACPAGMKGVGPVCWSGCPAGYNDMGAVCHINEPLTKSPEWVCTHWWPKRLGGKCRWKDTRCPGGYTNAGLFCALSARPTPAGFSGTYLDPMKNSQGRGAGTPARGCPAGKELQAGLCYDKCPAGMTGVGPVCWSHPPAGWVECGMGNARDQVACAKVIIDQTTSVANVALTVATMGASASATAAEKESMQGAKAAEQGEKAAAQTSKTAEAYRVLKDTVATSRNARVNDVKDLKKGFDALSACVQAGFTSAGMVQSGQTSTGGAVGVTAISCAGDFAAYGQAQSAREASLTGAGSGLTGFAAVGAFAMNQANKVPMKLIGATATEVQIINNAAAKMNNAESAKPTEQWTAEDYARQAAEIAAMVDPTGVSGAIAAYTYPKCSRIGLAVEPKKCCWNRQTQACTSSSQCDAGGEGCIVSLTPTKQYGSFPCL